MTGHSLEESVLACDAYLAEKHGQLAEVVMKRWPQAVTGAVAWARANRPDLVEPCDVAAEEHLGELRNNGLLDEFRPACVAFFRAWLELYRAHAAHLNGELFPAEA